VIPLLQTLSICKTLMNGQALVLVFMGGGLGSVIRFLIGLAVKRFIQIELPLGTLIANVLAAALVAMVMGFSTKFNLNARYTLLFATGLCGGLSTFSTFSWETVQMLQNNQIFGAFANILLNVILCLTIVYVVYKLAL